MGSSVGESPCQWERSEENGQTGSSCQEDEGTEIATHYNSAVQERMSECTARNKLLFPLLHLPVSLNQTAHSPPTSLIDKDFSPTELPAHGVLFSFHTTLWKLKRLLCVKIPGDLQFPRQCNPIWHLQSLQGLSNISWLFWGLNLLNSRH